MEVRATRDRGYGVFATRPICAGEVVLREAPLFVRSPAPCRGEGEHAALKAAARALRRLGEGPEVASLAWDFVVAFCAPGAEAAAARREVLRLHHPELDDPSPKVRLALEVASVLFEAVPVDRRQCALEELQRGLLVDLYNNFDGLLLKRGSRLNHACAPALTHGDYGAATIDGQSVRVAYACWNEQLDHRAGVAARTAPLGSVRDSVHGHGATIATASAALAAREPLSRLARAAEAQGAVALVAVAPGDGADSLAQAMSSAWAQPPSRTGCPRIPAFVVSGSVGALRAGAEFAATHSAGKEFRAARDILAGEELTISYLGPGTPPPRSARRAYLQGAYGFWCTCSLCEPGGVAGPRLRGPASHRCRGLGRLRRLRAARSPRTRPGTTRVLRRVVLKSTSLCVAPRCPALTVLCAEEEDQRAHLHNNRRCARRRRVHRSNMSRT